MKKYNTPNAKLVVCDVVDIITTSGVNFNMKISTITPDVDQVEDYAMFLN